MGKMPCLVLGWQEFRMVMSTTTNIQSSSYKVLWKDIFYYFTCGKIYSDVKGGVPVVVQIGGGRNETLLLIEKNTPAKLFPHKKDTRRACKILASYS